MDCSPLGTSIHGIVQARLLEQVDISTSRGSSWPRESNVPLLCLLHCQENSLPLHNLRSPLESPSFQIQWNLLPLFSLHIMKKEYATEYWIYKVESMGKWRGGRNWYEFKRGMKQHGRSKQAHMCACVCLCVNFFLILLRGSFWKPCSVLALLQGTDSFPSHSPFPSIMILDLSLYLNELNQCAQWTPQQTSSVLGQTPITYSSVVH